MSSDSLSDKSVKKLRLAAIIIPVLLLLEYPIAIFIPIGFGFNIFDFSFPSFLAASGICAVVLFFSRPDKTQKLILGVFGGLALLLLLSGFINKIHSAFIIHSLGIVLVPLGWAALSSQEKMKERAGEYLFRGLGLLWALNLLHCYFQVFRGGAVGNVGIAGNQNWLSAILFSTAPAVVYLVNNWIKEKAGSKSLLISILIVAVIAGPIILKTQCRASYLALLLLLFYIPWFFNKKISLAVLAVIVISGVAALVSFPDKLDRALEKDVRVEFWKSTLKLVADNPFFGIGAGQFEREFPPYKSEVHKKKLFSAHRSGHPHNEFLNTVLQSGVVGGLCWVLILGLALFKAPKTNFGIFCRISLFIMLVHSMADKPLSFNTSALIFYLLLGQIYSELLTFKIPRLDESRKRLFGLCSGAALLVFLFFIQAEIRSSWNNRQALRAKTVEDKYESYASSWYAAPWIATPAYSAFSTALKDLRNYDEAAKFYEFLNSECPDLRFFQLLKADYLEYLALQSTGQERMALLNAAKTAYERSIFIHGPDLLSHVQFYKFSLRYIPFKGQQQLYQKIKDIYKYKTDTHFGQWGLDVNSWGQKWLSYIDDLEKLVAEHVWLLWRLKSSKGVSAYFPAEYIDIVKALTVSPSAADSYYAAEMYKLSQQVNLLDSVDQIVSDILQKVKLDQNAAYRMPSSVIGNKSTSGLSRMCLIKSVSRFKGWEAILSSDQEGNWGAILFNKREFFLVGESRVEKADLKQVGEFINKKQLYYFDYPQAFFYKNLVLSHSLERSGVTPVFCEMPEYVIHEFTSYFPSERISIEILPEPFGLMRKKMQLEK